MTEQRKLRILEVSRSGTIGTSEMGPVSTTICALANGFDRLGHEVTVADTPAAEARTKLNPGIRIVTVPLRKVATPVWMLCPPRSGKSTGGSAPRATSAPSIGGSSSAHSMWCTFTIMSWGA